tara:strand:+ start:3535 stop:4608 length:1074 start_codon:yes stop_codon:yes gene_type:complete
MRIQHRFSLAAALIAGAVCTTSFASDHREAPLIQEDPSADIADLYAFVNPNDSSKLVLAMTVNPFSTPVEATTYQFSPGVRYRFNIDTTGDAIAESEIIFHSRLLNGVPKFQVELPDGSTFLGDVTSPTMETAANPAIIVNGPNGVRAFAGPRDDPFFFDAVGFSRFLSGTGTFSGTDSFAGFNVSAIVLEVPLSMVSTGTEPLQIWADTSRRKVTVRRASTGKLQRELGVFEQLDRVGVPGVGTAFIPSGMKDLYNIGEPKDDGAAFAGSIVGTLQSLGTDATNIGILASVAVPDTLKIDLNQPMGFPNGRLLADDVIDTILFFVFNQTVVPDQVDMNDAPFLSAFPFMAAPIQAP